MGRPIFRILVFRSLRIIRDIYFLLEILINLTHTMSSRKWGYWGNQKKRKIQKKIYSENIIHEINFVALGSLKNLKKRLNSQFLCAK